ncbi:MAG: hypothetical protein SVY41_01905 [Candidatus Nanohaloarchaea archaeon]|nr:hypothetical protein [Candidatus Nanohaloarchaea archaeon]
MTDVLDPSKAYIILFAALVLLGLGVGAAGAGLGVVGAVLVAALLGFVAGLYTERESTDIFGSLVLTAGFTAVVGWMLPLSITWTVAVFLLGFIAGMRTERR